MSKITDALEDGEAQECTEALAAETMARRACGRLLDDHEAMMRAMALRRMERRRFPRGSETIKPGTVDPRELARIEARFAREAPDLLRRWGAGKPRFNPEALMLLRPSLSRH